MCKSSDWFLHDRINDLLWINQIMSHCQTNNMYGEYFSQIGNQRQSCCSSVFISNFEQLYRVSSEIIYLTLNIACPGGRIYCSNYSATLMFQRNSLEFSWKRKLCNISQISQENYQDLISCNLLGILRNLQTVIL